MTQEEFSEKFKELFSGMLQLAFEYVENSDEVDTIYVYADLEGGMHYFNAFYKINGSISMMHEVNDHLASPVDTSMSRKSQVNSIGIEDAKAIRALFEDFQGRVPTNLKFIYSPQTLKFDSDISYDLHHTNTKDLLPTNIFKNWLEEIKDA